MFRDWIVVVVLIVLLAGVCWAFLRVKKKKKQKAETPPVPEQQQTNWLTQDAINEGTGARPTEMSGEKLKKNAERWGLARFFK